MIIGHISKTKADMAEPQGFPFNAYTRVSRLNFCNTTTISSGLHFSQEDSEWFVEENQEKSA